MIFKFTTPGTLGVGSKPYKSVQLSRILFTPANLAGASFKYARGLYQEFKAPGVSSSGPRVGVNLTRYYQYFIHC